MDGRIRERIARRLDDETGLGLAEIVVAMFIIALLAISLLPLLITGMKASIENVTIAAGGQFANDRMSIAAAAAEGSAPCTDLLALADTPASMIDARGVELRAVTTVGSCPSGTPDTVLVSTIVTRVDTGAEVAHASTRVLVIP